MRLLRKDRAPIFLSKELKTKKNDMNSFKNPFADVLLITIYHDRAKIMTKSISYSVPRLWNEFPVSVKKCNVSIDRFRGILERN